MATFLPFRSRGLALLSTLLIAAALHSLIACSNATRLVNLTEPAMSLSDTHLRGLSQAAGCPPRPTVDAAAGLGPDLIAVVEPLRDRNQLFITRECWDTSRPVAYNPADPFNIRFQAYCEAVEGGIQSGCHYVLRFTAAIGNIGTTDLYLGDPNIEAQTGDFFTYASCHNHWHWNGFAKYEMIEAGTGQVFRASKAGFCAIDVQDLPSRYRLGTYRGRRGTDYRGQASRYNACGENRAPACQGVSPGKMDVYEYNLAGQFFCISGCGSNPKATYGRRYTIRITANPPNVGGSCPFRDNRGDCRKIFELNYNNNVAEYTFTLRRNMIRGDTVSGRNVVTRAQNRQ